ncbi:NUDIX domain-containing protein [Geofilum rubicundum]|uniref:ADP-ribose pyrophosphatase, mitochondrial n=1 Tax=Geofilum rubicundum JCM 15548 TaxID=1236989 RepID=A0A0E9LSP2_9BACT|nr:NUDIX domain-containing protein [Geofilum rubicundum]GAO28592.1 ADP-ribose pyrophosphatase, mitochondrial precursor [Geofilum rubicundum JCM 15548]
MTLYEALLADYQWHRKSRTQKHRLYPARFEVPNHKVPWSTDFTDYLPLAYNAPGVLDPNTPWADPQAIKDVKHPFISFMGEVQFNSEGLPLNPLGRTGICGRGVLGKWGANFAADAIITTVNPTNELLLLAISRKDTGEYAFPGGMVDPGEDALFTRNRELAEELSMSETALAHPLYESTVSQGYVDDPRNTDNAWLETTAIHTHLAFDVAQKMVLKAGDDAADFAWVKVSEESVRNLYASHGLTLLNALRQLENSRPGSISEIIDAFQ